MHDRHLGITKQLKLKGGFMMKKFKLFIFLVFLFLANLSQATCFPTSFTPESYAYNYSSSSSNNVFNSLWFVRFDLTDTDVCRFDFKGGTDVIDQNGVPNYLKGRLRVVRDDASPTYEYSNNNPPTYYLNYSIADSTVAVTTTGNNFNTNNSSCWCDRTSNIASSTCSIGGLSGANNQVPKHSLLFKKCSSTNSTVPVIIKLRWVYNLNSTFTSFEYCPRDEFYNLGNTSETSPFGDQFVGPGTTELTLCQRVFVSRPTCTLNIPSVVNLPKIKPSGTVGVRQESKKPITVQLINCVNNRPNNLATNAFPKVVLTDSNGTSTDCYLKNMAATSQGGNSNTNNTVIALSLNQDFTNEVCLLDFSASRNNVLTFNGDSFTGGSGVQTFSQTIWAALRVSGSSPSTEVGAVRSKLMLKLDYD
jgi:hypothetical protein